MRLQNNFLHIAIKNGSPSGLPFLFIYHQMSVCSNSFQHYYGVDPYKSGALGAFLLTTRCQVNEILLVRLIRDSKHKADPNAPRRHGWTDYINANYPECKIYTVFIHPDRPAETMETLERFFLEHPSVKHVAMTNSRVFMIDKFLERHPDPERIVVGFDDLKRNLASLRKGNVEYLVTRHIQQQSFKALNKFAECVTKGTKPLHRNNYVHMDILHRNNLDDY